MTGHPTRGHDAWSTPTERRIDGWARRRIGTSGGFAAEFTAFVLKQAWASVFGAAMLAMLVAARLWYPDEALLSRSDALVIGAVVIQLLMLAFRLESGRELWVIVIFHVVGTGMEIFKTEVGSWEYGGDGLFWIGGVPLYSGFMYAAVGSYLVRVFRLFDLRFDRYPLLWVTVPVAAAIYANFFTHHYLPDARWVLLAMVVISYGPCVMHFRNVSGAPRRRMPLLAAFAGVAFFIWVAENIATAAGAWIYPHQGDSWELVSFSKLVSWLLLMIISVVLVTLIYPPRRPDDPAADSTAQPADSRPPVDERPGDGS